MLGRAPQNKTAKNRAYPRKTLTVPRSEGSMSNESTCCPGQLLIPSTAQKKSIAKAMLKKAVDRRVSCNCAKFMEAAPLSSKYGWFERSSSPKTRIQTFEKLDHHVRKKSLVERGFLCTPTMSSCIHVCQLPLAAGWPILHRNTAAASPVQNSATSSGWCQSNSISRNGCITSCTSYGNYPGTLHNGCNILACLAGYNQGGGCRKSSINRIELGYRGFCACPS